MNNYKYEELIKILANAPEEAVFWDGEDYLNIGFGKRYTNIAYSDKPRTGKPNKSESHYWVRKDPINTGKLSRLSDLKEILRAKEMIALAKVYCEDIVKNLEGVENEF